MGLRKRHGKAAQFTGPETVLETLPVDELPVGLPVDAREASPADRGDGGHFARGNSLAVAGGHAKAGTTRLATRVGFGKMPDGTSFAPWRKMAVAFRRTTCSWLAANVGGGICGPIPSSMVASGALALAWSRYFSDLAERTGDADAAAQSVALSKTASELLRNAHEYTAKEAVIRTRRNKAKRPDRLAAWRTKDDEDADTIEAPDSAP